MDCKITKIISMSRTRIWTDQFLYESIIGVAKVLNTRSVLSSDITVIMWRHQQWKVKNCFWTKIKVQCLRERTRYTLQVALGAFTH